MVQLSRPTLPVLLATYRTLILLRQDADAAEVSIAVGGLQPNIIPSRPAVAGDLFVHFSRSN
jgi:hypothetical protein